MERKKQLFILAFGGRRVVRREDLGKRAGKIYMPLLSTDVSDKIKVLTFRSEMKISSYHLTS